MKTETIPDPSDTLYRPDGRPITEREIERGLRINVIAGCGGMAWAAVLGMPLTMFMESLKASGVLIGLTTTVQQLAMLVQVPAAFLSEMLRSRKLYWGMTAFAHRAVWLVPAVLPFLFRKDFEAMAYAMVFIVGISAVLAQASAGPWWAWMSDLVPERQRNSFWSVRQSIVFTAYLAAVAVSGWVLDLFPGAGEPGGSFLGFTIVFGAFAVLGCADIVIHMWVPEPRPNPSPAALNPLARLLVPLKLREFRRMIVAMGIWAFGVGILGQFGMLYLKRGFGISYTGISATAIAGSLGVIVAGFLWSYVMNRIGVRNFGVITMLVAPMFGVVWFFMRGTTVTIDLPFLPAWTVPQPLFLLVPASFLAGAFHSGVGLAQVSLLGALAPKEGRTMAMAVYWSILGVLAAVSPMIGGYIMDFVEAHPLRWRLPTGTDLSFYHVLMVIHVIICWTAAARMTRLSPKVGEMGLRTAISRFLLVNPLRIFSSIYNIYAMGVSDSRDDRADAIRKIGEDKTAIAVSDLVERLDDPSLDVREEAALALGNIGSPDAVDALLAKLDDPHADMVAEIARALRVVREPRVTEALIRRLGSVRDRETICEIARSLGATGDRRAAEALMNVLQKSEDNKVVMACSEALARVGFFTAVYDILPRMKSTADPVLSRALTVSLGDLLGKPGGFYRVLSRELRKRGSETERLLAEVRRHAEDRAVRKGRPADEVDRLVRMIGELDAAYVEGRVDEAVHRLYEVGAELARLDFGAVTGTDPSALVEMLVYQDERLGVGMWFLGLLRTGMADNKAATADETDVLLGIYFLSGWVGRED